MNRNLRIMSCLILMFLLFSCLSVSNDSKGKYCQNSNSNVIETNDWKQDSLGCLKKRSKELSESLLKEHNLEQGTLNDFEKIFGKPNKRHEHNKTIIWGYYFDSFCKEGELDTERDFCVAEFYFSSYTLVKVSYTCL